MENKTLDPDRILATIHQLENRINDRFPNSGLKKVCHDFYQIATESKVRAAKIAKPDIPLRLMSFLIIGIGLGGLVYSISLADFKMENNTVTNLITLAEAIFNDLMLIGAAIFFLVTIEVRVKRKRAIKRLNELRNIAHVVDMHQLTKDPSRIGGGKNNTVHSPKVEMTLHELQRYLDYCSEMMSLVAKVAAIYSQSMPDDVVVRSVNEIESLTTGLSRKIWQKIVILQELEKSN